MHNEVSYLCCVRNGRIPESISIAIRDIIRRMEGKQLSIRVREFRPTRSNKQNAYYWGVVVKMVQEMMNAEGNDLIQDEVHELLKQEVAASMFVKRVLMPDGKFSTVVRSSSKLTTVEWENYMETVRAWAARHQLMIPLPNESEY